MTNVKNKKERLVPQLRFPGFVGNWTNDKFKNLTKINQGLQIPIEDRYEQQIEGSFFYITNEFLKKNSDKKYYILNPTESVLCNEDDVLMTRTGNTGQVVTNVSGAFHNNFFKIKFDREKITKLFLVYFLRLYNTQKTILRFAGTSTIPDLNHSDFYRIDIPHPRLSEQQKIASFLSAIDQRIRLLEQKKEALERYKKGVMQKLFAQEIRFKDDQGNEFPDWEEKRLGEIGTTYNGLKGKSKDDFGEGTPYVQYLQVFNDSKVNPSGYGVVRVGEKEKQNTVRYGDVFFTTSSETANEIAMSSVFLGQETNIFLNSFCFGYRPKSLSILTPEFSRYLFRSDLFRKNVIKLAQGSTRFNLSKSSFLNLIVLIPVKQEQIKIASFLSNIDSSIESINKKIKKVKEYKKGLLQKMFV